MILCILIFARAIRLTWFFIHRLCGARAVAVVDETAYVVSEMSNSLSVVVLPARLSKDFMGFEPPTIVPEFVGTLVDNRLEGAYAVAVNGANAYVASRWCKTCVVLVRFVFVRVRDA